MVEGVTTGKGHIKILLANHLHDFRKRHGRAGGRIPGIGIMTPGTSVSATGDVYGCTKAGAIHCGAPAYVKYIENRFLNHYHISAMIASRAARVAISITSSTLALTLVK